MVGSHTHRQEGLREATRGLKPFLSSTEVAELLNFPTRDALLAAIYRGSVPLNVFKAPGRRIVLFDRGEVEAYLGSIRPVTRHEPESASETSQVSKTPPMT